MNGVERTDGKLPGEWKRRQALECRALWICPVSIRISNYAYFQLLPGSLCQVKITIKPPATILGSIKRDGSKEGSWEIEAV